MFLILVLAGPGCLRQDEWPVPPRDCFTDVFPNTTWEIFLASYKGETEEIRKDWFIKAYVISSDRNGNFFNTLHVQNKPMEPTSGLQVELEFQDSHLFYPAGTRLLISLKGLYLGKSKGIYKLGSAYASFGNLQIGRIPKHAVSRHIFRSCESSIPLMPRSVSVPDLRFEPANTLVQLGEMEFSEEVLDSSFAIREEQTLRKLLDCQDREISLRTSGYSDFYQQVLPGGKGAITGIYYPEGGKDILLISSPEDLNFSGERCEDVITEVTSEHLLITEIADPDNNSAARFVELHYTGTETLSLKGWHLDRYTNDNPVRGSSITLSDFTIDPGQFLILASDLSAFEETYGFAPDVEGGLNSPADSNGDDNLVLVDPFGKIIDIFGVIGEDGSGTTHEFEDGKASRRPGIYLSNPVFTPSEWDVFNDTGASGTVNQPQNAPQDFTPGRRQ